MTTVLIMEETLRNANAEANDHPSTDLPVSVYSEGIYEVQLFSWEKEETLPEHEHPLGQSSPCNFNIRPLDRLVFICFLLTYKCVDHTSSYFYQSDFKETQTPL